MSEPSRHISPTRKRGSVRGTPSLEGAAASLARRASVAIALALIVLARPVPAAEQITQELLVEIGRGLGLRGLRDAKGMPAAESTAVVQLDEAAQLQQLPAEWIGYEGVDALFLGTSQELDLEGAHLLAKLDPQNAR